MKVERLFLYPIKSIRGIELDSTALTKFGFSHDRCFMCLKVVKDDDGSTSYKNTAIAADNEMCRFFPSLDADKTILTIVFKPLDGSADKTVDFPLEPDTEDLEVIDVLMHKSPTKAYRMPDSVNDWFTECFGYDVVLAYIGNNTREVRLTSDKYKSHESGTSGGWLSSVTNIITGSTANGPDTIKFSDVAPYLVVSSKSMDDIHKRLPDGETFDITKFRPNVIVSGAQEAWEEDYWAELTIGDEGTKIECEHNCGRCRSINIDYETGAQGEGEAGKMLKKMSSDRRIDKGTKWSPVFGRYSFLHPSSEGREIKVGDAVTVSRRNKEHTAFGKFFPAFSGWSC